MLFDNKSDARAKRGSGTSVYAAGSRQVLSVMVLVLLALPLASAASAGPQAKTTRASSLLLGATPVAEAGANISVIVNTTVVFDGSLSAPSDGATITDYNWTFTYEKLSYELHGVAPNFTFNVTTVTGLAAEITLNVTDSNGLYATDTVWVFVRYPPPTFLEKYWLDIILLAAIIILAGYYGGIALRRVIKREPVLTEAGREKLILSAVKGRKITWQLMKNPMGLVGVVVLAFFIFMGAFGPMIAPYPVDIVELDKSMQFPSPDHWLGTDNFGRDIFSELLFGAQTSIIVGIISAVIASFLGAAVGLYSGYVGGWKDEVVMRLNDVVLSIPWLVLMIIVAAFVGKIDLTGIILIIGLTGWSTTARMVRAQVLSVKERQYVERARAIGASEIAIIRRHIFPNTFPLIFANTILTVAVSILSEATLSFLGLRPAGVVTWGTMLSYANEFDAFSNGLEWWILAPGFCIVGVVLGFTLLGYALDEILNPKLRRR